MTMFVEPALASAAEDRLEAQNSACRHRSYQDSHYQEQDKRDYSYQDTADRQEDRQVGQLIVTNGDLLTVTKNFLNVSHK